MFRRPPPQIGLKLHAFVLKQKIYDNDDKDDDGDDNNDNDGHGDDDGYVWDKVHGKLVFRICGIFREMPAYWPEMMFMATHWANNVDESDNCYDTDSFEDDFSELLAKI